jgi:hypothetical protein
MSYPDCSVMRAAAAAGRFTSSAVRAGSFRRIAIALSKADSGFPPAQRRNAVNTVLAAAAMRLRDWFHNTALQKQDAKIRWPKPQAAASLTDRIISPASPASVVQ